MGAENKVQEDSDDLGVAEGIVRTGGPEVQ